MGILYCCLCCCFNNLTSKSLEIVELVFQSISLFLLFLSLIIIKWSKISVANILLFLLMLLITLLIIVFTSFIRYWRANNLIKTTKKLRGICFASTCFGLIITCFIICTIEVFVISYGFYNADYPCSKYLDNYKYSNSYYNKKELNNTTRTQNNRKLFNKEDCYQLESNYYANAISRAEYLIAYLTFTYLEFSFILGVWIWYILRKRIVQELDGPMPTHVQPAIDPYGRQVVVVQPGDIVYMDGRPNVVAPVQNPNNYQYYYGNNQYNNYQHNNNVAPSQNISDQINNNRIPNSQEYNLQQKDY